MIESWYESVVQSLHEFGRGVCVEVSPVELAQIPAGSGGAVIPLTGHRHTYLLGIMAPPERRHRVACRMLGEPDSCELSEEEVDDAVGELLNLAAGWLKCNDDNVDSGTELGLPMSFDGPPTLRRAIASEVRGLRFGDVDLALILLQYPLSAETVSRRQEAEQRELVEIELRLSQKLEAVGQLAAGIAHEINTPTQYVSDNINFLSESFGELLSVLNAYEGLRVLMCNGSDTGEQLARLTTELEDSDMEFLCEEIPRALSQSRKGVGTVARIVRGMKVFSHPGGNEKAPVELNQAIDATITVSRNEWKTVADMEIDLQDDLPAVPCHAGDLNQVVLNLIVNAAHALADKHDETSDQKGKIRIATRQDDEESVTIEVSDTGPGIPEEIRERVFDPFFTTKEVGKGTGQGLAMARSVVVDKHGGSIQLTSTVGAGTTFLIRLPLTSATSESSVV